MLYFFSPLFNGFHNDKGENTWESVVQNEDLLTEFLEDFPKLSEVSADVLESAVTSDELWEVLSGLCQER